MTSLATLVGAGRKSIQRALITISPGNTSGTATVTAVNTAKAELSQIGFAHSSGTATDTPYSVLTNSTTITATRGGTTGTTTVSVQLVENY